MTSLLLNDRKMANLPTVIDPHMMAERFVTNLRKVAGDIIVERCAIEEIHYRPGHSCGVLYRLDIRKGSGMPADQWVWGKVYPGDRASQRYQEALAKLDSGSSRRRHGKKQKALIFSPVSFWQDLNMVTWTFPFDPELPSLSRLVAPDFIKSKIAAHYSDFGLDADWRCEGFDVDRVKFQPGHRCVLRYNARFNGPGGGSRRVTFYGKTYNDARSRIYFEALRSAHAGLNARSASVRIPADFAPRRGQHHLAGGMEGQALLEALEERDWETLFPALATAVADLHKSSISGLRPGPNLDTAMKIAGDEAMELLEMMPHLQQMMTTMLLSLEEVKMNLEKQTPTRTPIHGAMCLEKMLVHGHELAVLNFETLALGDPLFDIGAFIAALHFLELSRGKPRRRLTIAAKLFFESYAAQVPWSCDRRRFAWYALAFWISKMFGACKNLDANALPHLETAGWEIAKQWLEEI
jgi:hypothetical protein